MKQYIILFLAVIFEVNFTFGQVKSDCFEVKYLDFFGFEASEKMQWPASELDQLLVFDFKEDEKEKNRKTNWLIPFIMVQLKEYHPNCSTQSDTTTFRKLKQLYFKIRQADLSVINNKSVSQQLEYIRQDFYSQVHTDSLLPYMGYTLDDGPFYGEVSTYIPDYNKGTSYKTDFGTLIITKDSGKIFITVLNLESRHLWTRIMTGNSNRPLSQISFSKENVFKDSLGYSIRMFSEGEALNLYLKSNGEFRYYFHSW
jgi:hypothetical protein